MKHPKTPPHPLNLEWYPSALQTPLWTHEDNQQAHTTNTKIIQNTIQNLLNWARKHNLTPTQAQQLTHGYPELLKQIDKDHQYTDNYIKAHHTKTQLKPGQHVQITTHTTHWQGQVLQTHTTFATIQPHQHTLPTPVPYHHIQIIKQPPQNNQEQP